MALRSIAQPSSSHVLPLSSRSYSKICSSSLRSHVYIPKLEPFSRSKIDRHLKEPSLIEKSEAEISDYCSVLEGDASFSCWRAYFELKDLEKEISKDDLEKLIHETEGVKSLIAYVHGVSDIHRRKKEKTKLQRSVECENVSKEKECPVPDGLPRSVEEIEEEEKAKMPDSPYTRMLRTKGRSPAWFTQAPDHETD